MDNQNNQHNINNNMMEEDQLSRGILNQCDEDDGNDRRVHPNHGVVQIGSFRLQVCLTRGNLHPQKSRMAGVVQASHINPNAPIILLQSHMQNGPHLKVL
eukprot:13107042-Ditylum_brightwellii.AAC.1